MIQHGILMLSKLGIDIIFKITAGRIVWDTPAIKITFDQHIQITLERVLGNLWHMILCKELCDISGAGNCRLDFKVVFLWMGCFARGQMNVIGVVAVIMLYKFPAAVKDPWDKLRVFVDEAFPETKLLYEICPIQLVPNHYSNIAE